MGCLVVNNHQKHVNKETVVNWTLLMVFLTIAASLNLLNSFPSLTNTSEGLISGVKQVIVALPAVVFDSLIILLGANYQRKRAFAPRLVKFWLILWLTALGLVFARVILVNHFSADELTSALFPLTRNLVPAMTGILCGYLLADLIEKPSLTLNIPLVAILCLSLPFGVDAFGLTDGTNPLLFTILFLLGANALPTLARHDWHRGKYAILTGIVILMFAIISLAPPVMPTANPGRFALVGSTSVTFLAFALALILVKANLRLIHSSTAQLTVLITIIVSSDNTALEPLRSLASLFGTNSTLVEIAGSLLTGLLMATAAVLWAHVLQFIALMIAKRHPHFIKEDYRNNRQYGKALLGELRLCLPQLCFFAFACFLALASMVVINKAPGISTRQSTLTLITSRKWMWVLTAILIWVVFKALWQLTRRFWLAGITTSLLMILAVTADLAKILIRNEPIMPTEVGMVSAWGNIAKMINPLFLVLAVMFVVLAEVVAWRLDRRFPHPADKSIAGKVTWSLLVLLLFASSLGWNHPHSRFNNFMTGLGDQPSFYDQLAGAELNGPLIQFMNNVDVQVMTRPKGYSKQAMMNIRQRYLREARVINQHRHHHLAKQSLVFVLSESLSNPNRVPGVRLNRDPLPNINALKANNTGGVMMSSGYGGGTANMEYMALTGMATCNFSPEMSIVYTQLIPVLKHHPTIVDSFNYAVGIHPYSAAFYNRIQNYKKFGFNRFYYLGSKYKIRHRHKVGHSNNLSDQTAYANAVDELNRHKGGQFINLITMQNHFPYTSLNFANANQFGGQISPETDQHLLEEYSASINATDTATADFIHRIDRLNKPVTVVLYGDHLPGTIYGNSLAVDGVRMHETDYFIYSNRYAREHGARNLKRHTQYVSPSNFIAMAAAQTNSKVDWYQALLTRCWQKLPAYSVDSTGASSRPQFVKENGQVTQAGSFTREQRQLWHDYQLIQYDVTAGHHYLVTATGFK